MNGTSLQRVTLLTRRKKLNLANLGVVVFLQ